MFIRLPSELFVASFLYCFGNKDRDPLVIVPTLAIVPALTAPVDFRTCEISHSLDSSVVV